MKKIILIFIFITLFPLFSYTDMTYTTIKHSFVEVDFSKFYGHSISVGSNYDDWKGIAPLEWNTSTYSSNEFIYIDALYDDTGDGDYTYPTNSIFTNGMADITEFRVTYDTNYLYLYVKLLMGSPEGTGWWVNGIIIGISEINAQYGNYYLIEGDGINPDLGPAAEINTAIKIQYTLFASSTYRIRMWNYKGEKIGDGDDSDNSDGNLNNIKVKAVNWNIYEIGIPFNLIGTVKNKKYKFFVASCFEENQMVREVQGSPKPTEWYITGGDRIWWNNLGVDPDVMDLIGAEKKLQEEDLNNYQEVFYDDSTSDLENFNMDIYPYIFTPGEEDLTIFFTLNQSSFVTINIKDLNNNIIKNICSNKNIIPDTGLRTIEFRWDGTDNSNHIVGQGIYIVEVIFNNNRKKIMRKVVRIW